MLKYSFEFLQEDLSCCQAIADVESISNEANSNGTAMKVVMLIAMISKS
jgi:hypothetical protein